MTTDDDQTANAPSSVFFLFSIFAQMIGAISVVSLITSYVQLGFDPIIGSVLAVWRELSYWITTSFGVEANTTTTDVIALATVVTLATISLWLRVMFRPRARLHRVESQPGSHKEQPYLDVSSLGTFTMAFVEAVARFVAAPVLSCMATLSLTLELHIWIFDHLGPNYAAASVCAVIVATCLLLSVGLKRLIPGNG